MKHTCMSVTDWVVAACHLYKNAPCAWGHCSVSFVILLELRSAGAVMIVAAYLHGTRLWLGAHLLLLHA